MFSSKYSLAIIVPYRDRKEHLSIFLPYMKKFFLNFDNKYHFFIVEQLGVKDFNRGKLKNIGFSLSRETYDYFCFHDIDMLPISKSCDYSYVEKPTHLSKYVEQFQWKVPSGTNNYFGGVVLFDKYSFSRINGFYNDFWGWGCEDDDLFNRCNFFNIKIERRAGVYKSLYHKPNGDFISVNGEMQWIGQSKCVAENRFKYSNMTHNDYLTNGLSNLKFQLKYNLNIDSNCTLLQVDL